MRVRSPYSWRWSGGLLRISVLSNLLLFMPLTVCLAQVATHITPDGTLGTEVSQNGTIYSIAGGTRPGGAQNLFHSFGQFNVGTGDTARFASHPGVNHIIGRVTGDAASMIDGMLQADANLFLLNPQGIMFGENATLDLNGSFYASTADVMRFEDGSVLSTRLNETDTLTVAAPSAFGFLHENPAGMAIAGSTLEVPEGGTLAMVGGNIEMTGGSLEAPSGRIHIASVASLGDVTFHLSGEAPGLQPDLQVDGFERFGEVRVSQNAVIDASGAPGGTVAIRGGRVLLDGAHVAANTLGDVGSSPIAIEVLAGDMVLTHEASMRADTLGAGDAGAIQLTVDHLHMEMASRIRSETRAEGRASDITVRATTFTATGGSRIDSWTSSTGQGGKVAVRVTGDMTLRGESPGAVWVSSINTSTVSREEQAGAAGHVSIQARNLIVADGANIKSTTYGAGPGGHVSIDVTETLAISGTTLDGNFATAIGAQTDGRGNAGRVSVQARDITISDGGAIVGTTFNSGQGGDVTVQATGTITLSGTGPNDRSATNIGSNTQASTLQAGDAGDVLVEARDIVIADGALIQSDSHGMGQGGNVTVRATDSITLSGIAPHGRYAGGISANAQGHGQEAGDAGTVLVEAHDITVTGGAEMTSVTFGPGQGGNVTVRATGHLTLSGVGVAPRRLFFSNIAASAEGLGAQAGDGGSVWVEGHDISITDGAAILSESTRLSGAGRSGDITVRASGTLTLRGSAPGRELPNSMSNISSQTISLIPRSADGGDILVEARDIVIADGAQISTDTLGAANSGHVTVRATGDINLRGSTPSRQFPSGIFATTSRSGNGGDILVEARHLSIGDGARVSAMSAGDGPSGAVTIRAAEVVTLSGQSSGVFTNAAGAGMGGNITLEARRVHLNGGSTISAESTSRGHAGSIRIAEVDTLLLSGNSAITTQATQAGGGNITIETAVVSLTDSDITAEAQGASQRGSNGGNITIQSQQLVLNRSAVKANAFGGNGGQINIMASEALLADVNTCARFACLDASSELGVSGTVEVQSPVIDISEAITPLSPSFAQDAAVLSDRCAARLRAGAVSSLIDRSRDRVATHPDGLLPRRLYHTNPDAMTGASDGISSRKSIPANVAGRHKALHVPFVHLQEVDCK